MHAGLHPPSVLKTCPASSAAPDICDEAWSVRETLPFPPLTAVRTESRQEAEREEWLVTAASIT